MTMPEPTIQWAGDLKNGKVRIIEQTLLPEKFTFVEYSKIEDLWEGIKMLRVRGAPAIGIAGAYAVVLGIRHIETNDINEFRAELEKVGDYVGSSRPTAVNLFWAIDRMKRVFEAHSRESVEKVKQILFDESNKILEEDKHICRAIGKNGLKLVNDGDSFLTHCNAGGLATGDYGTALAVFFTAHEAGRKFHVFMDETRPLLQGARLTAWELMHAGINCTLICDNMAGMMMRQGKIDKIITGADRIARNGDAANKIGTYSVAVLAQHHGLPFYIAAPLSTFDTNIETGEEIPIEQRKEEEITCGFGKRTAPEGVPVYNPAFDVTPAGLIAGFITENGIASPPFDKSFRELGIIK